MAYDYSDLVEKTNAGLNKLVYQAGLIQILHNICVILMPEHPRRRLTPVIQDRLMSLLWAAPAWAKVLCSTAWQGRRLPKRALSGQLHGKSLYFIIKASPSSTCPNNYLLPNQYCAT
jgi:hypothetical protein